LTKTSNEKELYANVLHTVRAIFDTWYLEVPYGIDRKGIMHASTDWITNPHLEDTHIGNFSEEIKSHFDIVMFGKLYGEELRPDIMGYVSKKEGAKPELITIEVKLGDLKITDVMQARLYELFFKSKFTFLLSPTGMSREKIEAIMQHDNLLRGNVIVGKCGEDGKDFRIDPKIKDKLPKELKEFQRFCRL
jgi:hypothetical protein